MRVLFVCRANACRSPAAEAVFRAKAWDADLDAECDSAGTSGRGVGRRPDARMREAARARGYDLGGLRARRADTGDFYVFDLICPMDEANAADLAELRPPDATARVVPFLRYGVGGEVPDPYRGGTRGLERVLDLIEHASDGLVAAIRAGRA